MEKVSTHGGTAGDMRVSTGTTKSTVSGSTSGPMGGGTKAGGSTADRAVRELTSPTTTINAADAAYGTMANASGGLMKVFN